MSPSPRSTTVGFALLLLAMTDTPLLAQEEEGQISGVVVDAAGKPAADQRVELRRPSLQGPGRVVAITDANGAFTYTRLRPGRYEVELVVDGSTVARSGAIELSVGTTRVSGVMMTQPTLPPSWVHTRRHVTELPRVSARQLLGGQGVATSFEALQAILKPGHQVVFAGPNRSGLATAFARGGLWSGLEAHVAEVSSDRLVLVRRRFFRTEEIVLTEEAVRRISIVDPTTKGALLGAAVGGSLGLALILDTRHEMGSRDCNLCPLGYMMGVLLPIVGTGLGAAIDHTITEPIYERQPRPPRVTLAPLLGQQRIGLMAQLRF